MLRKMGFVKQWISWLMLCISIVEYFVLLNGTVVGSVVPGRGLRQRFPLSPYLFIVCAKGLFAMIRDSEARGVFHGCSFVGMHPPSLIFSLRMIVTCSSRVL